MPGTPPAGGDGQDVREKKPTPKGGRSDVLSTDNRDNTRYKMSCLPRHHHLQMEGGSGQVQVAFGLDLEKEGVYRE